MIERLFEAQRRYGEPAYGKAMRQILAAEQALGGRLDRDGRLLLEGLEEAYLRRERAMALGAFAEGFSIAAGLALEVRERLAALEETPAIYYNQEGLGEAPGAFPHSEGE